MILIILDRDGTIIKNNNFFGKDDNWKEEIEFNNELIKCLKYINSKFDSKFIIITNQAGVARNYFTEERVKEIDVPPLRIVETKVKEINKFIVRYLEKEKIHISDVQYCPYVDSAYAKSSGYDFRNDYIKEKTKRKPSIDMVFDSLRKLKLDINHFKSVIVFGDRHEDELLAKNLNAKFIDVKERTSTQMIKKFNVLILK